MGSTQLNKADIRRIVETVNIPTLPTVVTKVNQMVNDPSIGLMEIGATIAQDAPIASRVLRIANSPYYGLQNPVRSAEQAAAVIGARALQSIAMQASVMNQYDHLSHVDDFDLVSLWRHAILTAQLSQLIAQRYEGESELAAEEYYTCGLLHDIGKVVLLDNFPDEYLEVFRDAREHGRAVHLSEKEILGTTHTEIGALVAVRWDFPEEVVQAIRHHHGPRIELVGHPNVAIVALADQIGYRLQHPETEESRLKLVQLAETMLELPAATTIEVLDQAARIYDEIDL